MPDMQSDPCNEPHPDVIRSASGERLMAAFRRLTQDPTPTLAWVLILLGATVLAGWMLRIAPLTQVLPGMSSMVIATALNFVLLGTAVLRAHQRGMTDVALPWLIAPVMLLATLHLIELLADVQLGIDLTALHDWVRDSHRHPGQMSLPTAICFELAGITLLLQRSRWAARPWAQTLGHGLSALVFCVGAIALVGYVLGLERLYRWYAYTNMALHTAAAMEVLALALWFRQNALDTHTRQHPEARILSLGSWSLVLVAVVAGITGAWVLRAEVERNAVQGLSAAHRARVQMLDVTLTLRSSRAQMLASRPGLRDAFLTTSPATVARRDLLEGLQAFGFTYVALRTTNGAVLDSIGAASPAGVTAVPLDAQA